MIRCFISMMISLALAGCGENGPTTSMSGIAWSFSLPGEPYTGIEGATVSVLEAPALSTTTNADGAFTIEGLPVGSQATFKLEHSDHPITYTKTFTVSETPIDNITFQTPPWTIFDILAAYVGIVPDETKCQMVSTFTRFGKTIGDAGHHGQAGAVLSVQPTGTWEQGPIYFDDNVLPDSSRTYSSLDGGVLIVNVEPGDYAWSASCVDDRTEFIAEYPADEYPDQDLRCADEDLEFDAILLKCRPNVLVNASPSYGLQAHE